jgi:hypothetical protein
MNAFGCEAFGPGEGHYVNRIGNSLNAEVGLVGPV